MENKKEEVKVHSGVGFHQGVEIICREKTHTNILLYLMEMALILLTSYSMIFGFVDIFQIEVNKTVLFSGIVICISVYSIIFLKKSYKKIALLNGIALYLFFLFMYLKEVIQGIQYIANHMIPHINEYYGINLMSFLVEQEKNAYAQTICFIFLMIFSIGIMFHVIFSGGNRLLYVLFDAIYMIFPFAVGIIPKKEYLFLFFAGTIILIGNRFYVQSEVRTKIKMVMALTCFSLLVCIMAIFPEKSYQDKIDVDKIKVSLQDGIQEFMEGDVLRKVFEGELIPFSGWTSGGINHGKLGRNSEIRYSNKTALRVTVPKDETVTTMFLRSYVGSQYTGNEWIGLEQEDQANYEKLVETYKDSFQNLSGQRRILSALGSVSYFGSVTIENCNGGNNQFMPYSTDKKVWLDSNGKLRIDKIEKEKEYMLSYESKMNEYVYDTLMKEQSLRLVWDKEGNVGYYINQNELWKSSEKNTTNIVGESSTIYEMDGFSSIYDGEGNKITEEETEQIEDGESYKYSSKVFYMPDDSFSILKEGNEEEYMIKEIHYRNFVYDVYTKISENAGKRAREDFKEYIKNVITEPLPARYSGKNFTSVYPVVDVVRDYIAEQAEYTLKPGTVPKGNDVVDYFLFESKKGYCSHYASAAVILLRSLGVPARYVEGYVVTTKDYQNSKKQGRNLVMDIKDTNAHAWVEVYLDYYGWVPVEVTEGYTYTGTNMELPAELTGGKKHNTQKPKASRIPSTPKPSQNPEETLKQTESPTKTPELDNNLSSKKNTNLLSKNEARILKIVSLGIIVVISIILSIVIRRKVILKKLDRQLNSKNPNRQVICRYQQIEKIMIVLCHLKAKSALEDNVDVLIQKIPYITKEKWNQFISIGKKATFGQTFLEEEEKKWVDEFYISIHLQIYENATKIQRLYYHYILIF